MEKKKTYSKRGNPYKRGKSWTFIYYTTDPQTAKKEAHYKGGFATKKEAKLALKETEAQILMGQYVQDKKTTLESYINHWFHDIHAPTIKPNTINGYQRNIYNHIIPALGGIPIGVLSRIDIQKFYNSLLHDKKLNVTTVLYVHRVLRKALSEAVLNDLIVKNPCNGIKLPKKKKYHATVLSNEQIKELLQAVIGSNCELEVLFAITLGLRRGEVLGVRFGDFNFEKKTLTICQQITTIHDDEYVRTHTGTVAWGIADVKTDNGNREIYVPQAVLDSVKKRELEVIANRLKYGAAYKKYDLVCCKPDGDIVSPQTAYHRFKDVLKTTSLPDMRFHDLRHSCATALLDMDVPLKVISQMLGHSSIKITADIYCDVLEKKKQPAQMMQEVFFAD